MEIIIKVDHDELGNVKTFSTKNSERDQLIHTIKYRDDQLHHIRIRQDELLMNLQNKNDEIQDLKLENDRLKKREDLMHDFICSISCNRKKCRYCKLYRPDKFDELGAKCAYLQGGDGSYYIRKEANSLLKKLEDL